MSAVPIGWVAINTAVILAITGYLWRQTRKVDVLYQAFFGVEGRNGFLRRLDEVMAEAHSVDNRITNSRHDIRSEFTAAILRLHDEMQQQLDRRFLDMDRRFPKGQ